MTSRRDFLTYTGASALAATVAPNAIAETVISYTCANP
jgi:hypothetical protein